MTNEEDYVEMELELDQDLIDRIDELVESGLFASRDAVVEHILRRVIEEAEGIVGDESTTTEI